MRRGQASSARSPLEGYSIMIRAALCSLGLLAMPCLALAQESSGGTAHLYAYRPSDPTGFEQGYKRHLRGHASIGDLLVWYGWHVVSGDRQGAFVDGTFGTSPAALAARPEPEGDAADFRETVAPFAQSLGDERWELWREVSQATTLEDRLPRDSVQVLVLLALDTPSFEAALAANPPPNVAWYRAPGGGLPVYMAIAPVPEQTASPNPELILSSDHLSRVASRPIRAEVWRYDPALTLIPDRASPQE
jgi:hypothetical protein